MKIITANEAAKLISNGMSVGLSGSSATCIVPDRIYEAIENRYLNFSEPKGLTLVHPQGQGNKDNTGMSRFAGVSSTLLVFIVIPEVKRTVGMPFSTKTFWSPMRFRNMSVKSLLR